ncbi:ras-related and estrogen-regulated growth inhibitor isoform X1 [Orcinus orca]|uniref:Ras-related and estrogen-regulated growth inhibitor n=2 Tax=Delphinidae TaxID=9726 RepID=A0A2U4BI02_TURTR|nr:ras-related and estrogen-regulated growth inhibitor isoform X1 [Tursiops truncatus]XP_019792716.1 ras-related and estrogen-regulated growth inhibitor isoform X1 [Tursiops truncatus]XP_026985322.1 ras-related and estrogen-regulated growth inhibitor isoform X1 [Lagenorhynchus obliquidens]XP_026985323.1 ras-related and estrogen-regulated growth inhibitor isoform X1 [Lagenorhynchus obliquidens]XP_033264019.1 ras-related and estrogen-regulated growth inhibitor isoform X1 [Orcinus orca]XP_0332640
MASFEFHCDKKEKPSFQKDPEVRMKNSPSAKGKTLEQVQEKKLKGKTGQILVTPTEVAPALVVRFLTKRFIWEYDPTLESTYRHQATIDDEVVTMEILDTAGQEDTIQREGHMRWGEGFVLVYDVTDRGSFEEVLPLKNILDEIKKPKNVTLILVGNKADLDHSRQVSTEEGEKLATELACAFYECSACTGEGNITEIFYELCREVRRRRMVQGKTRRRSSTTHVKQAINKMLTKISS